jgi:uncharacterized protein YdeI (YjbR/CyaY-like superfamily)
MNTSTTNNKVDFYFRGAKKWQAEFIALRKLVLECGLEEQLKWGNPCYTFEEKNIVLIHGFKEYCALLFFKGALLKDPKKILIQQTQNVQAARQIRFKHVDEIKRLEKFLKAYVADAIKVEKAGHKVEFKKVAEFAMAEEFQQEVATVARIKIGFLCTFTWQTTGIFALFFFGKTTQNPRGSGRKMHCSHSRWLGPR